MGFIIADQDGGGFRDFLEGKPIHAGDSIDMWHAGKWIPGRYEMHYHSRTGYFYTRALGNGEGERVIEIERNTMQFRWAGASEEVGFIIAGHDSGGFRDFLKDKPIHTGDGLDMWSEGTWKLDKDGWEIWQEGKWISGRYEADYPLRVGYFYHNSDDGEQVVIIDRYTMKFKWPTN